MELDKVFSFILTLLSTLCVPGGILVTVIATRRRRKVPANGEEKVEIMGEDISNIDRKITEIDRSVNGRVTPLRKDIDVLMERQNAIMDRIEHLQEDSKDDRDYMLDRLNTLNDYLLNKK